MQQVAFKPGKPTSNDLRPRHKEYPVYLYMTRPSQDAIRSGQATQRGATALTERVTTVLQWIENAAARYWSVLICLCHKQRTDKNDESSCYARLQGREVAYCYGRYTLDLPGEGRCLGFIVERYVTGDVYGLSDWTRIVRAMDSEKPIIGMIERGENVTLTAKQFGTIVSVCSSSARVWPL